MFSASIDPLNGGFASTTVNASLVVISSLSESWPSIVGYSFPFFNRDIDRGVIERLRPSVETYYLQYPEGKHQPVVERIVALGVPEDRIHKISGTDLFYLPHDFQ